MYTLRNKHENQSKWVKTKRMETNNHNSPKRKTKKLTQRKRNYVIRKTFYGSVCGLRRKPLYSNPVYDNESKVKLSI